MNETVIIIQKLSNIIWNYFQHGDTISKDSIIKSIKGIVDDYNGRHDKKINY